jgi:hypothetical protein
MIIIITIIQSSSIHCNSYLFTCKLDSPEANYRVSTSKKKEITKYYEQNKNQEVYIVIKIIIIPLKLKLMLRVEKRKVRVYDLQWLRRYAAKEIYIYA